MNLAEIGWNIYASLSLSPHTHMYVKVALFCKHAESRQRGVNSLTI